MTDLIVTNPLGSREVCELLGCKLATLRKWIERGQFIEPVTTITRTPIWERHAVIEWQQQREAAS